MFTPLLSRKKALSITRSLLNPRGNLTNSPRLKMVYLLRKPLSKVFQMTLEDEIIALALLLFAASWIQLRIFGHCTAEAK